METIKQLGPNETYRTLGAHINVAEKLTYQLKVFTKKTRDWSYQIQNSPLTNEDKLLAYDTFILPKILFPLPCMYAEEEELRRVHLSGMHEALNCFHFQGLYHTVFLLLYLFQSRHCYVSLGLYTIY